MKIISLLGVIMMPVITLVVVEKSNAWFINNIGDVLDKVKDPLQKIVKGTAGEIDALVKNPAETVLKDTAKGIDAISGGNGVLNWVQGKDAKTDHKDRHKETNGSKKM